MSSSCLRARSAPSRAPASTRHWRGALPQENCLTWDAAQVTLTRLMSEIHEERHPKTNISVGQAIDQWLDVADLAQTTRDRYLDLIRLYIRPVFGDNACGAARRRVAGALLCP